MYSIIICTYSKLRLSHSCVPLLISHHSPCQEIGLPDICRVMDVAGGQWISLHLWHGALYPCVCGGGYSYRPTYASGNCSNNCPICLPHCPYFAAWSDDRCIPYVCPEACVCGGGGRIGGSKPCKCKCRGQSVS